MATARRFVLIAFAGTLGNVVFTTTGWPAIINWLIFIAACTALTKLHRRGPMPLLKLRGWRRVAYWLLLFATIFIGIALLNLAYTSLGLVDSPTIVQVKLAVITAILMVIVTGSLLYRFPEPQRTQP
ncbi:hypothetical protein D1831_02825 [Lactiplantibacillus garii]|uniref:Uncharacterized protein n=1 Tax=Lactiplantibacillus garii TaxID=2306423 RepID=A0A426D9S3_9LACO|nr:hypothetical protein [Lactiplantibacillus garii]RRK11327.1 hypothetical protein D1831_02825 [Lactiplantibacillus garii]